MPIVPTLKFFKPSEFKRYNLMDPEFLLYLDEVRSRCGFGWFLTSDARPAEENARVGGVATSLHLADQKVAKLARAVDFVTATLKSGDRPYAEFMRFVLAAIDARDQMALDYSVQAEIVYSPTDRHYHLGLHRDLSRPDELIFARE